MSGRILVEGVTLAYLRECFTLDAKTGEIFWKVRPISHFSNLRAANSTNKRMSGLRAGAKGHGRNRVNVHLMGKYYLLHRIVFSLANSVELKDLPDIIDHIDGDESNNAPSNLRPATHLQSSMNRGGMLKTIHNAKGVQLEASGLWTASITCSGKRHHLGTFQSKEEAAAAYIGAAKILHGEYFRDPRPQNFAA